MRISLLVTILLLIGCSHQTTSITVPTPPPTPVLRAVAAPPIGEAVAAPSTAAQLPLIGAPVIAVTNPPPGFTSTVFVATPGTMPTGPGLLGFISPLGSYIALGLDPSITVDTISAPYPVLKVPQNPVLQNPPVTYRAIFMLQADGTWTSPASFNLPLPDFHALILVYRNGSFQSEPGDYLITYNPANGGTLILTPALAAQWQPDDTVRAVWVL